VRERRKEHRFDIHYVNAKREKEENIYHKAMMALGHRL
jgi:hypothetical protein